MGAGGGRVLTVAIKTSIHAKSAGVVVVNHDI